MPMRMSKITMEMRTEFEEASLFWLMVVKYNLLTKIKIYHNTNTIETIVTSPFGLKYSYHSLIQKD